MSTIYFNGTGQSGIYDCSTMNKIILSVTGTLTSGNLEVFGGFNSSSLNTSLAVISSIGDSQIIVDKTINNFYIKSTISGNIYIDIQQKDYSIGIITNNGTLNNTTLNDPIITSKGKGSPIDAGYFDTWMEAKLHFQNNTYPKGTSCTIGEVYASQGSQPFVAKWMENYLKPIGEIVIAKLPDTTVTIGAGEVSVNKLFASIFVPKSFVQNARKNIDFIFGNMVIGSSSSGLRALEVKNASTRIMYASQTTSTTTLITGGRIVSISTDYTTYSIGSASGFMHDINTSSAGNLSTTTIFQGSDSVLQLDYYYNSAIAETTTLRGFEVKI